MVLRERLEASLASDGVFTKPALVVQGGGMRGVYSIAALSVLEEYGLRDAFSLVIGSSAGAINGAYFLAGQAHEGVEIYVETLSGSAFVSVRRPWRIVDMDFLVDVALRQRHPLRVTALRGAGTPLFAVLTDAETGEGCVISVGDSKEDIYEIFRATGALPALYNKRIRLGQRTYVDGGVHSVLPLAEAVRHGAKEVLVVVTRRPGYRRQMKGPVSQRIGRVMARGQSPAVKRRLGTADVEFNATMAMLEADDRDCVPRTWTVWPSDAKALVSRTCIDREKLRACAVMAAEDMRRLLESDVEEGPQFGKTRART